MDVLVNFRASAPTREVFRRAAEADGMSLSAWLRRLAVRRVDEQAAGVDRDDRVPKKPQGTAA